MPPLSRPTPAQLSETAGLKVTTERHRSCALVTTMSAGQMMTGGVLSHTMTHALQALEAPLLSVTVSITMLAPKG